MAYNVQHVHEEQQTCLPLDRRYQQHPEDSNKQPSLLPQYMLTINRVIRRLNI